MNLSKKSSKICVFSLENRCFFGERCRFRHPQQAFYWTTVRFADRATISFNESASSEGKHTISDYISIGEELIFSINCLQLQKTRVSSLFLDFSGLNFANCCAFGNVCCTSLGNVENLETLQLSLGEFQQFFKKLEETQQILQKCSKLRNFSVCGKSAPISQEIPWFAQKSRLSRFVRVLRESALEFFEIDARKSAKEPLFYQEIQGFLEIIKRLFDSRLKFLKLSLDEDCKILLEPCENKLIFTVNFRNVADFRDFVRDFWEEVAKIASFRDLHANFVSDWFSGTYSHQFFISKLARLSSLELDFRRVHVSSVELERLWTDLQGICALNQLKIYFANAYIEEKVLVSVYNYLEFARFSLKVFFIRVKIKFISEDLLRNFLMIFTEFRLLQRLELSLDLNLLNLWAEDGEKRQFFNAFVAKLLRNQVYLLYFCYVDRTHRFQLQTGAENWLFLRKMLVFYLAATGKRHWRLRKQLVYMNFRKIHGKFFDLVHRDLDKDKERLFWIFDTSENESEGAFYDRFLQI